MLAKNNNNTVNSLEVSAVVFMYSIKASNS